MDGAVGAAGHAPRQQARSQRSGAVAALLLSVAALIHGAAARKFNASGFVALASPAELQALADSWRLTPQQAAALGRPDVAGKMRICITPYTPQVYCDARQHQDTYTGYQVEVFRELAERLPWLRNTSDWFFDCLLWTPMTEQLWGPNSTCMMSPSSLSASKDRLQKGQRVSWSIDKEGFSIIIKPSQRGLNLFTPFTVFTPGLWLLLLATSLVVGVLIWVVDTAARNLTKPQPRRPRSSAGQLQRRRPVLERLREGRGRRRCMGSSAALAVADAEAGECAKAEEQQRHRPLHAACGALLLPGELACEVDTRKGWDGGACPACKVLLPPLGDAAGDGRRDQYPCHAGGSSWGMPHTTQYAVVADGAVRRRSSLRSGSLAAQPRAPTSQRRHAMLWLLGVRQGEEKAALKNLQLLLTRAFLRMPDMGDPPHVGYVPGKVVLFAYGLLILIIVALYTANAAAQLTAQSLRSDIRTPDDLRGKAVATWDGYADRLREQGIAAIRMPWETMADEEDILDTLRTGAAQAVVMTTSFVDYVVARNCDLAVAGESWALMDAGIGYNRRLQLALTLAVDRELAILIEDGVVEQLYNVHIRARCEGPCAPTSKLATELNQVAGLWVMLLISLGIAVASLAVYAVQRHHRRLLRTASAGASRLRHAVTSAGCKVAGAAGALRGSSSGGGSSSAGDATAHGGRGGNRCGPHAPAKEGAGDACA